MTLRVLLVLSLFTSVGAAQGGEPPVFRVHDIEFFTRPAVDAPVAAWELPIRGALRAKVAQEFDDEEEESGYEQSGDFLVRLIREYVGAESWEESGVFMRLNQSSTRLFVRQSKEIQTRIERLLKAARTALAESFEIEALVVEGGPGALASLGANGFMMGEQKFAALRAGRSEGMVVVASCTGRALDGQRIRLESRRIHHLVGMQSAQIAQSAGNTEPDVIRLASGVDLFARPQRMPDGRVNLRLQGQVASLLAVETHTSPGAGVHPLELPHMRVRKLTSSVVLESGKAAVLGCIGSADDAPRFLVIRATGAAQAGLRVESRRGVTRAFSAGYLTRPYLATPRLELGWLTTGPRLFDEAAEELDAFSEARSFVTNDDLFDLLRRIVTPRFWEENVYTLEVANGRLWATAGPEQHKGLGDSLESLARSRGIPLAIDAYCVLADRAVVATLRADGADDWVRQLLRHPATLRLHTAAGFAETGSRIEWAEGREFAYVGDAEVDVAQGADIAAPVVETGFTGMYLRIAPFAGARNRLGVDFDVEVALPGAGGASMRVYESGDYKVQTPVSPCQRAAGRVDCAAGAYTVLAEFSPSNGGAKTAFLIARVRP